MSTMASLINDEDSAQSGQLSAENWRSYIFHCSDPQFSLCTVQLRGSEYVEQVTDTDR